MVPVSRHRHVEMLGEHVRCIIAYKCIGDDTKAAARQNPNCIKKTRKINYGEKRFSIWRMKLLHPAMWHEHDIDFARCGSGIVTVNSPSGSTLQCDTWLCDDMPWNLPKRSLYWNSTSGFDFDHITAVDMSFCEIPVCEILFKSDHPRQKKMTACRFSR